MKKLMMSGSMGLTLSILFFVTIIMLSKEVQAESKVIAVEDVSYSINSSLAENLKSLVGKKVQVSLGSGDTVSGVVKEVGNHLVHLEKLKGKEYFDALIRIKNINAISTRFRKIKR